MDVVSDPQTGPLHARVHELLEEESLVLRPKQHARSCLPGFTFAFG